MMSCSVKKAELATFPQLVFPRKLSQNLLSCQRSWTECGFSDDLYHLGYNRGVKHLNCLSSNGVSKLKFTMLINCDVESGCYVLDNVGVFVQTLLSETCWWLCQNTCAFPSHASLWLACYALFNGTSSLPALYKFQWMKFLKTDNYHIHAVWMLNCLFSVEAVDDTSDEVYLYAYRV